MPKRRSSRALWAAKLAGQPIPRRQNVDPDQPLRRKAFRGMILGIDPSLRGSGLAVLNCEPGDQFQLMCSKTVKLHAKLPMSDCLGEIFREVSSVLGRFSVEHVAVEETIYVQNFQTAQILGAARGAAIAAVAVAGIPVYEYAPLRVKQAVVGFGRASKEQVARTVKVLLGCDELLNSDEADAVAVALCHAFTVDGLVRNPG